MRQLPQNVSNEDTISDWSLSSKMAKIPTLERLYECGEVLANAKGLTHKVFTFTLKFRVWTHFRALDLLYIPRLTGRSTRRSYLVFKEMTSARGSVRSSLEGGTSFSFYILENCITTLRWPFFFVQVLPPLPRPLPAVDRRNARPVRGRQHDDQDAGFIIFYFAVFS